jgi:hypothetical protein
MPSGLFQNHSCSENVFEPLSNFSSSVSSIMVSSAAPPRTAECNPWRRRDAYLFVLIIHAANSLKSTYGRAIQVSSEGVRPVVGWEPHIATSVLVDILHDLVKLCCGKLDVTLGHQFSYLLLDQSACFAAGARGQTW